LRPGGWVVLEIAENQAAKVASLLLELGYENLRISSDMAGRDRVIEAQWRR
jgi:methylase of polypeptide subunit release factors